MRKKLLVPEGLLPRRCGCAVWVESVRPLLFGLEHGRSEAEDQGRHAAGVDQLLVGGFSVINFPSVLADPDKPVQGSCVARLHGCFEQALCTCSVSGRDALYGQVDSGFNEACFDGLPVCSLCAWQISGVLSQGGQRHQRGRVACLDGLLVHCRGSFLVSCCYT